MSKTKTSSDNAIPTIGPSMQRLMARVEPALDAVIPQLERRSSPTVLVHEIAKVLGQLPSEEQQHLTGAMAVLLEQQYIKRNKRRGFPSMEQLQLLSDEKSLDEYMSPLIHVGDDNSITPFIKMQNEDWDELHDQDWDRVARDTSIATKHDGLRARVKPFLAQGMGNGQAVKEVWRECRNSSGEGEVFDSET